MTMTNAHTHSHRVRGLVAATALAVALAVATAPEVSRAGAAAVDRAAAAQAMTPTTGNQALADGPKKKKKKRNIIAWFASLLSSPPGPPEFAAYDNLANLRCDLVFGSLAALDEPTRTLYTGAADACLAAFAKQRSLWPGAAASFAAASARSNELTCMGQATLALLGRILAAHKAHPKRAFRRASPSKAKAPPCPHITGVTPSSGPAGTVVRLTGTNLVIPVTGVDMVDSTGLPTTVTPEVGGDGSLTITMPEAPPAEASAVVCIVLKADPDWDADGALFTYTGADLGPAAPIPCPPTPPPKP